jgi:hypothetical protein
MKHVKEFENWFSKKPEQEFDENGNITPSKLKSLLVSLEQSGGSFNREILSKDMLKKYPEILTDPTLKDIWTNYHYKKRG